MVTNEVETREAEQSIVEVHTEKIGLSFYEYSPNGWQDSPLTISIDGDVGSLNRAGYYEVKKLSLKYKLRIHISKAGKEQIGKAGSTVIDYIKNHLTLRVHYGERSVVADNYTLENDTGKIAFSLANRLSPSPATFSDIVSNEVVSEERQSGHGRDYHYYLSFDISAQPDHNFEIGSSISTAKPIWFAMEDIANNFFSAINIEPIHFFYNDHSNAEVSASNQRDVVTNQNFVVFSKELETYPRGPNQSGRLQLGQKNYYGFDPSFTNLNGWTQNDINLETTEVTTQLNLLAKALVDAGYAGTSFEYTSDLSKAKLVFKRDLNLASQGAHTGFQNGRNEFITNTGRLFTWNHSYHVVIHEALHAFGLRHQSNQVQSMMNYNSLPNGGLISYNNNNAFSDLDKLMIDKLHQSTHPAASTD
ncbi:hypothetical protein F0225_05790 [Vibrio pectenicida]|uniref:Uncharacterized protein n=1 Tax=Vibrio pectenicida TaxID=62763 RepID=A0A7Y3ZYL5_9VIBR|nr:hypothetical protein [Vibrio pectenicida]NOH70854.1 hypothetical protein [Vibrio pectenicida]